MSTKTIKNNWYLAIQFYVGSSGTKLKQLGPFNSEQTANKIRNWLLECKNWHSVPSISEPWKSN